MRQGLHLEGETTAQYGGVGDGATVACARKMVALIRFSRGCSFTVWLRFYFNPRKKWNTMTSGNNRGQKECLLASSPYASIPDPRQNEENNRGKKSLLH